MVDEGLLLKALESALAAGGAGLPPGELKVLQRGHRRRSFLYFVGMEGDTVSRWVVKCPVLEVDRLGIRPPMTAEQQFDALSRLHDYFEADPVFAGPRPVALFPELGALAMEFVQGRSVWDLVRPGALRRPAPLLDGVEQGARAIHAIHLIEPASVHPVELDALERQMFDDAARALQEAGITVRPHWFAAGERLPGATAREVVLHGDWAPENVLLGGTQVFCLDPELTHRGWAEQDLARFLLMLLDRSLFVATDTLGHSRRLRHQAVSTFLGAYYGSEPVSAVLRPLLIREVAHRWAVRHSDVVAGGSRLRWARIQLLRRYFSTVLEEVNDPGWARRAHAGRRRADPREVRPGAARPSLLRRWRPLR